LKKYLFKKKALIKINKTLIGLLFFIHLTYGQSETFIEHNQGLLWEVTNKQNNNKFYLFGSLHSNEKSLFNFPDSLYIALYNSDLLVLEANILSVPITNTGDKISKKSLKIDRQGMIYATSNKASKTACGSEDGMPQFIDAYFQNYANISGMKVGFLETIKYQKNILNKLDVFEITNQKEVNSGNKPIKTQLKTLYLNANIHKINSLIKLNLSQSKTAYKKLIIDRNLKMTDSILELIKDKNVFCIVGVGHLGGKQGILNLLKRKDYNVRAVRHTISSEIPVEKTAIKKTNQYHYTDTIINLKAEFPGKPIIQKFDNGIQKIYYNEFGQGNTYSIEVIPHEKKQDIDELANVYINNSNEVPGIKRKVKSGELIIDGVSDTYTDGLHHIRIIQNDNYYLLIKAVGGNKFMSSKRHQKFFGSVWFY